MRRLIFRLSSLGDIVVATAALGLPENMDAGTKPQSDWPKTDWVVAREFAPVLEGHPGINKLWQFDRKTGFDGWKSLCRLLWQEGYDEVFDLHSNLRTWIARVLFFLWGLRSWILRTSGEASRARKPSWQTFSKQRLRTASTLVLRRLWPRSWRPTPVIQRFAATTQVSPKARPNLQHLAAKSAPAAQSPIKNWDSPFLCIMPSAQWATKIWPVKNYVSILLEFPYPIVVLGTSSDMASTQLVEHLQRAGKDVLSGVGKWTLIESAAVLARASLYLGSDTGLAHMAEALGVPAIVVRGPTGPETGYGTWLEGSQTVHTALWCQPCSKFGQRCYRLRSSNKSLCMRSLDPLVVKRALYEGIEFVKARRGSRS